MADIIGRRHHILGIAPVDEVAGVAPLLAHRLPAGHAEFALAAGVVQPRHADQIALLDVGDAGPECRDGADALVTGNQGQLRLHRPIAFHGVQVGVADTARHHLDQYLARPGRGYGHVLDHERCPELVHDCRLHRFRHSLVLHVFVLGDYSPISTLPLSGPNGMPSRKRIGESVPHPARGLGPRLQFPVRAGSVRRWTDLASQVSSLRSARYDRTAPTPHSCRDSQSVTRILPRGAETIASPGRWEAPDTREIDFEASSHSETRTNRENA